MTARLKSYYLKPLALLLAYLLSQHNEAQEDGTSGQDRESYSDDQDRDSYTVDPELEDDPPTLATAREFLRTISPHDYVTIFEADGDRLDPDVLLAQLAAIIDKKEEDDALDDLTTEEALDEIIWPGLDSFDDPERVRALCLHLDCDPDDLREVDNDTFEYARSRYKVLTDSEADEEWDKELDRLFEEIVEPEVPEHLRDYLDSEKWKSDARSDGRGHTLNGYNGSEDDETDPVSGETYYIYRN